MNRTMDLILTLRQPVIIADNLGGQNHTASGDVIPGSAILGALASAYISRHKLGRDAHKEEGFRHLFLDNSCRYLDALLSYDGVRLVPIPMNIEKVKGKEAWVSVFDKDADQHGAHKKVSGYILPEGKTKVFKPKKEIFFHTARHLNGLTGKSEKDEGHVFSYEALAAGQTFISRIIGSEEDLNTLRNLFPETFKLFFGRSRTAQYGCCEARFSKPEPVKVAEISGNEIILSCVSPTILISENGNPMTTQKAITDQLSDQIGIKVELLKTEDDKKLPMMISRTETVEKYNACWGCKRWSEQAFSPGTVLCIRVHDEAEKKRLLGFVASHGLGRHTGEGAGELHVWQDANIQSRIQKDLDFSGDIPPMPEEASPLVETILLEYARNVMLAKAEEAVSEKSKILEKFPKNLFSRLLTTFQAAATPEDIEKALLNMQKEKKDKKTDEIFLASKKAFQNLRRLKVGDISLADRLSHASQDKEDLLEKLIQEISKTQGYSELVEQFPSNPLRKKEHQISLWKDFWIHYLTLAAKNDIKKAEKETGNE